MQVAIWDWVKVHERAVYKPHGALTNNIRFLAENSGNTAVTAGTDGRLKASSALRRACRGPVAQNASSGAQREPGQEGNSASHASASYPLKTWRRPACLQNGTARHSTLDPRPSARGPERVQHARLRHSGS